MRKDFYEVDLKNLKNGQIEEFLKENYIDFDEDMSFLELVKFLDSHLKNKKKLKKKLIEKYEDRFALAPSRVEELLDITTAERNKLVKKGLINVLYTFETKIYRKYTEISMYSRVEIYKILNSEKKMNEIKDAIKLSDKKKIAIEKAKLTKEKNEIKKYTCPMCQSFRKFDYQDWEYIKEWDKKVCPCCCRRYELDKEQLYALGLKKEILENKDQYVILDCETTGINYSDKVIEIAIIDLDKNVLLNTLVNTDVEISEGARWSHGITKDMLKGALEFKDLVDKINAIVKDKIILVYHRFALNMLLRNYSSVQRAIGFKDDICVEAIESACRRVEYEENQLGLGGKRRALSDCLDILELLHKNTIEDYKEY